jgi:hypothetical protein
VIGGTLTSATPIAGSAAMSISPGIIMGAALSAASTAAMAVPGSVLRECRAANGRCRDTDGQHKASKARSGANLPRITRHIAHRDLHCRHVVAYPSRFSMRPS